MSYYEFQFPLYLFAGKIGPRNNAAGRIFSHDGDETRRAISN